MRVRYIRVKIITELDPPFNAFKYGIITAIKNLKGRRYIKFKRKVRGIRHPCKLPRRMTYARYLYTVKYWREHKRLLPKGYDVDHINDDRTDDRIENLQLLPHTEHVWKRDAEKYGHLKVKKSHVEYIKVLLGSGFSWSQLCEKTKLAPDLLRYILVHKVEGYNFELNAEMNLTDIRRMVKLGKSIAEISLHFGVSTSSIRRVVSKYKIKKT